MKTYTTEQVIDLLRAKVLTHGLRGYAAMIDADYAFVCRVLQGKQPISENLGAKIGFNKRPDAWTRK